MTADAYAHSPREEQMERAVADLVTLRGGRLFHVRRTDLAPELVDLPDWLIIAPWMRTVALIEAKSQQRIITAGQAKLIELLAECDRFESGIMRPDPAPGEIAYDNLLEWLASNGA